MAKPSRIIIIVSILGGLSVALLTGLNLLDTLVIPHAYSNAGSLSSNSLSFDDDASSSESSSSEGAGSTSSEGGSSESSEGSSSSSPSSSSVVYQTGNYSTIDSKSIPYHLLDVTLKSTASLHRNIVLDEDGNFGEKTYNTISGQVESLESEGKDVLAAINGDTCFFSNSNKGYVIANGKTYRTTKRSSTQDDLALFADGSILSYNESDYSISDIQSMNGGCYHNWVFGPSIIKDGSINVTKTEEIEGKNASADPRTAIGYMGKRHFVFLTTEILGARNDGSGFRLYDLASLLLDYGCTAAYNLDGGLSACMYERENGYLVNSTRKLSDIIYVYDE